TSSGFVLVPVPPQHVMAVYGLLASLDTDASAVEPAEQVGDVPWPEDESNRSVYPSRAWTTEELVRFIRTGTKMTRTIGLLMDLMVEHPDEWLSTTRIVEATGVSR